MVRVHQHLELIGGPAHVVPAELVHDAVRVRVEGAHEHVQVAVVVGDAELGAEARGGVLPRPEFVEAGVHRRDPPDLVVVPPVDARRMSCANGYGGAGAVGLRLGRACGEREREDGADHGSATRVHEAGGSSCLAPLDSATAP